MNNDNVDSHDGSVATQFPEMAYLLGYYHMNWIDDPRFGRSGFIRPDDVLIAFVKLQNPKVTQNALDEFEHFMKVDRTEIELHHILRKLEVNIRPAHFGFTSIRHWLEHVRSVVTQQQQIYRSATTATSH